MGIVVVAFVVHALVASALFSNAFLFPIVSNLHSKGQQGNACSGGRTTTSSSVWWNNLQRSRCYSMKRQPPEEEQNLSSIPQLPPIGDSSYNEDDTSPPKPFVANRKVQLQYTCNVCETRNTQSISRVAYHKGVVIVRCKGCETQHLIVDHLGWTGFQNNTILEDFLGDIPRVTEEVFELERILQQHDASGAIVGDNGLLAME